MLTFKQFLNEEEQLSIDNVDSKLLHSNMENINAALDAVTNTQFVNSALFTNAVRGTLERFGILLPKGYEYPMLSSAAESKYDLSGTGLYLYVTHNMSKDGYVEGYAQIVDADELDDLNSMDDLDDDDFAQVKQPLPSTSEYLRQTRRTNDDSGNDDEY